MSAGCCPTPEKPAVDPRFRKALWVALFVNAAMFVVEVASGFNANSVSLLADAADFLGDSANYALSLFVLGLAPAWRSRAALLKGFSMGAYGVGVLALAAYNVYRSASPDAPTMGIVGFLALAANVGVAAMLYRFRGGDSNMRSVWLCSRNDAIGNVAILFAAAGVLGTGSMWPDIVVAGIMAALGITASFSVVRQSLGELRGQPAAAHGHDHHGHGHSHHHH